MANDTFRSVSLRRTSAQKYVATNARGGELSIGAGGDSTFTPVELLLAAIAGCSAIDVDILVSRRAEPEQFDVEATGDKIRDDDGNRMTNLELKFRVRFPESDASESDASESDASESDASDTDASGGDAARALLPDAVAKSHDRLCTVSRTIELGSPVTPRIV